MKYISLTSACFLLLFSACTTDTPTFTTPSLYQYAFTKVKSQKVYEVINGNVNETTQHPFDADLTLLNDSIEQVMNVIFETGQILSFQFIDDTKLKVKGTELSASYEREGTYLVNGSKLTFGGKDVLTSFSENFEELYYCGEFSIIKGIDSGGRLVYFTDLIECTTHDHKKSAQNILDKYQGLVLEHVAVIYIDMVYKKQ